jgi:hypothetical protein
MEVENEEGHGPLWAVASLMMNLPQMCFYLSSLICIARNKNLKVPVYFLKAKQVYTVRNMEKFELIYIYIYIYRLYILISVGMKLRNKKKFRCDIPACTGPFRALAI